MFFNSGLWAVKFCFLILMKLFLYRFFFLNLIVAFLNFVLPLQSNEVVQNGKLLYSASEKSFPKRKTFLRQIEN